MKKINQKPPSSRTKVRRIADLALYDQPTVNAILDEAYVCNIAFHDGECSHCIPTAFWRIGNYLYIHGSNGGRLTKALLSGIQTSIAVTLIDGLVLAKSAFNHSMHYRSVVIYGIFEQVKGSNHKLEALDAFMDKIAHGRKNEARPGNAKELAATTVMRISLSEAAAKVSQKAPSDKDEDMDLQVWAGILPMQTVHGKPIPLEGQTVPTPNYVTNWETQ